MPIKDIIKSLGEGVVVDANSFLQRKHNIIHVSPALDMPLNGGIPTGSWVIISGPEKCGKSLTALQMAANAQNEFGMKVFYSDVECRLKEMNLRGIHNLDLDNFTIISSTQKKILSAEDHLNSLIDLIKSEPNSIFILDSSSALCASKELVEEITANTRALGPKLLASFCRQMGAVIPVQNSILIIIQHLIANTSGYGSPYMEDSGRKLRYQVDVKLRAKGVAKWEIGDKQIGQAVDWEVVTSALGSPGGKCTSYIRYGHGIDKIFESIKIACEFGLISTAGSWFTLDFLGEGAEKVQGQEKVFNYLQSNQPALQLLFDKIAELSV